MATTKAQLEQVIIRLQNQIAVINAPITEVDDPRLKKFWENIHALADLNELCSDYDDFLESIGAPPRARDWKGSLSITTRATSEDNLYEIFEKVEELIERHFDGNLEVEIQKYTFEEAY